MRVSRQFRLCVRVVAAVRDFDGDRRTSTKCDDQPAPQPAPARRQCSSPRLVPLERRQFSDAPQKVRRGDKAVAPRKLPRARGGMRGWGGPACFAKNLECVCLNHHVGADLGLLLSLVCVIGRDVAATAAQLRPQLLPAQQGTEAHAVSSVKGWLGVFNLTSSETYWDYIVNPSASGCVEVDAWGRRNVILVGSRTAHVTLSNGVYAGPADAVKLVCAQDSSMAHAFPVAISALTVGSCATCGTRVPY